MESRSENRRTELQDQIASWKQGSLSSGIISAGIALNTNKGQDKGFVIVTGDCESDSLLRVYLSRSWGDEQNSSGDKGKTIINLLKVAVTGDLGSQGCRGVGSRRDEMGADGGGVRTERRKI